MEIQDITSWVNLIKSSMSILRDLVSAGKDTASMLPNGQHKTELEHKLKEAEEKVRLTELQIPEIAQKFGHPLCHCTFPPQIMLGIG